MPMLRLHPFSSLLFIYLRRWGFPNMTTAVTADLAALEALYGAHHRQAVGLAYKLVGDLATAEDVVQDAFLAAWRALPTYDPARGTQRVWLLAIVRNRAYDTLRARRQHPVEALADVPAIAEEADVATDVVTRMESRRACTALTELPDDQRRTIEMAYFGGLTQTEIATQLSLPLGTVKSRVRLGLGRLRGVLNTRPPVAVGV
jgi:RNA polymerase sigma-70 factor, ECF subfamily